MALITLTGISKTYDATRPLLVGVSFTVREGDRVGLIGPNGSGKSTLLRILAGFEEPDVGERVVKRGLRIGALEQEPHFDPERTVREVVRSGLEGRDEVLGALASVHDELARAGLSDDELAPLLRRQERLEHDLDALGGHDVEFRVEATIDGVGLPDPEARIGNLSGGEVRRVALARLLMSPADVLLLDEPTNHLDAFVVAWLETRLAEMKVPLVLVTHDRYLLDRVVDRIVEIDRGSAFAYDPDEDKIGTYARYLQQRAARLENEARTERSRLNLLRRETEWMRRGPPARTTKAKARIGRYEALVDAEPMARPDELEMAFPPGPRLGTKVALLHGVEHRYGERVVLPKLDLELENGMRLGVVGPNGAGKSTLLRILLGRMRPSEGEVELGSTTAFSTIDQKREDLDPEKTVVQEVAGDSDHVAVAGRKIHVAGFLDRFLFPGDKKNVLVRLLSGGERGRILLAKLMLAGGNVLVLDEPTNDLDLSTLRALEEAIVAFEGASVIVSHDRWFLDRVATHVLHLDGKGGARLHTGDLSSLLERLADEEAERAEAAKPKPRTAVSERAPETSTVASPKAAPKKLAPWERRELDELTERIAELEDELAGVDERLVDPALYTDDGSRARALNDERERLQSELDEAMERWEVLAEREG